MHNIKVNMIVGFILVSILGTLFHYLYKWTGENLIIGLFTPTNESTFEHMKLLFFPGILYLPIASYFLKDTNPYIRNALSFGILIGTAFIPTFFYTYSGILENHYAVIDIFSFYLSIFLMFFTTYRLLKSKQPVSSLGYYLLYVCLIIFLCFTYQNPQIGIFTVG